MTRSERDRLAYLFVHIPKTGGQSLRNHFIEHLVFHEDFIHLGPYGIEDAKKRGLPAFEERSLEQRRRAFVVLGHYVTSQTHQLIPGKEPRYITFLRDPAERMVSLYNYRMYDQYICKGLAPISFEAWYRDTLKLDMTQWICRQFLGKKTADLAGVDERELAQTTLDRFWFVGTIETFDEDVAYLMRHLGLPPVVARSNVTGVHFERTLALTGQWRQQIYRNHEHDLTLHRHYLERRRAALKAQ